MTVSLHAITIDNWLECVELKPKEEQASFVSPNTFSLTQAHFETWWQTLGIYAGEVMVGFVMFGLDPDDERYYLVRLMVDEKHQGKGYGKAATLEVINQLRQVEDCREVYLSFVPENTGAERVYKSIGFEPTGEISQGEVVMRFVIENNGNPKSEI